MKHNIYLFCGLRSDEEVVGVIYFVALDVCWRDAHKTREQTRSYMNDIEVMRILRSV